MTLTFLLRAPCGLCGYRLEGITVGGYRINKHSLVTTSPSISAMQRDCPECGWRNEHTARITESTLDAESKQRFNAYRDRKGWVRAA
jgi:ribosomal protein S27AE